jgi:hypothetical protein
MGDRWTPWAAHCCNAGRRSSCLVRHQTTLANSWWNGFTTQSASHRAWEGGVVARERTNRRHDLHPAAIHNFIGNKNMRDLTVATIYTYSVGSVGVPVLCAQLRKASRIARCVSVNVQEVQAALCSRIGAAVDIVGGEDKLGVSRAVLQDIWPVKGVRHPAEGDTCGWYIWAGEYSEDPDFFMPFHARHVFEARPEVVQYLGLAPGWGFVIAPGYEDVWWDEKLLEV